MTTSTIMRVGSGMSMVDGRYEYVGEALHAAGKKDRL